MAGKASKKFDLGELTRALSDVPEAVPKSGALCLIPLDDLLPNPKNPYPLLDEDAMLKLMDSIEDAGLLEPVSAYPMGDGKYMLVSGHNRREAYRRLRAERDDGTHRWDKIPCVIAEAPDSAAKERIILVEANRQRVKSPKILTMEMETIGDAYYELVQAGQKPPGRKRDWIAKQMDITSARVGRLAKISKGLSPCYKPLWDAGDLPEDTADALAGLPQAVQERIKRVCPKKTPTASNIREIGAKMKTGFAVRAVLIGWTAAHAARRARRCAPGPAPSTRRPKPRRRAARSGRPPKPAAKPCRRLWRTRRGSSGPPTRQGWTTTRGWNPPTRLWPKLGC